MLSKFNMKNSHGLGKLVCKPAIEWSHSKFDFPKNWMIRLPVSLKQWLLSPHLIKWQSRTPFRVDLGETHNERSVFKTGGFSKVRNINRSKISGRFSSRIFSSLPLWPSLGVRSHRNRLVCVHGKDLHKLLRP